MAPNRVGMGWFAGNRPSLAYFPSPSKFTTVEYVGQARINGIDRISQLKAFGDPEALIELNDLFHAME